MFKKKAILFLLFFFFTLFIRTLAVMRTQWQPVTTLQGRGQIIDRGSPLYLSNRLDVAVPKHYS